MASISSPIGSSPASETEGSLKSSSSDIKGSISMEYRDISKFTWLIPDFFPVREYPDRFSLRSNSFLFCGCKFELELLLVKKADFVSCDENVDGDDGAKDDDEKIMKLHVIKIENGVDADNLVFELVATTSDGFELVKHPDTCLDCKRVKQFFAVRSDFLRNTEELSEASSRSRDLIVTCMMTRDVPRPIDSVMQLSELAEFSEDFEYLLVSEKVFDVKLKVKEKEFKAHRAVLAAQSTVLAAMLERDHSDVVEIPDFDPVTFEYFLRYLYTGNTEEIPIRELSRMQVAPE